MKKYVLGITAFILAASLSAFTTLHQERRVNPQYGNTQGPNYTILTAPYNDANCDNTAMITCGYQVTDQGVADDFTTNHPTFTDAEAANFVAAGDIEPITSSKGLYNE